MSAQQPVLDNIVKLPEGIAKRLHFTSAAFQDRAIKDPVTQETKVVTVLVLVVDQEDGVTVAKTLGVTAEGLAAQLAPYLDAGRIGSHDFTITRRGSSFATRYAVEASPRA